MIVRLEPWSTLSAPSINHRLEVVDPIAPYGEVGEDVVTGGVRFHLTGEASLLVLDCDLRARDYGRRLIRDGSTDRGRKSLGEDRDSEQGDERPYRQEQALEPHVV